MLFFCAISLGAAALALLVSRATLTQGLRDRAPEWLRGGISCPFCVSFWTSAALVAVYGPGLLPFLPWPLAVIAIWGGAAVAAGVAAGEL